MADTDRVPGRARRSGDGAYRPDAAVDQHASARFEAQGRDEADWGPIEEDARAVAEAPARSAW